MQYVNALTYCVMQEISNTNYNIIAFHNIHSIGKTLKSQECGIY